MDIVTVNAVAASILMLVVAASAVIFWRRVTGIQFRWLWVGAALWAVAVIIKGLLAGPFTNLMAGWFFEPGQSYAYKVVGGGLFVGFESSLSESSRTKALRQKPKGFRAVRAKLTSTEIIRRGR